MTLPNAVREQIVAWLQAGDIEVFIGWEAGPIPFQATPAFARTPEDVDRLIWDATCENNLVAFLPRYHGKKVGIMVKGCDSRAINGLMTEGQLLRENLRIVGVSCPGVVDPKRVAAQLGVAVEDLEDVVLEDEAVVAGGTRIPLGEAIYDLCLACDRHNPIVADVQLNAPLDVEPVEDVYAAMEEMASLSDAERWARFTAEVDRCNLCFACRNACPLCYCNVCFADRTQPRWFNQTTSVEDKQFYQVMRTFHLAGRCVGCGACTRACPQGVNIRLFLDKLRYDAAELFQYEAGVDPEAKPPLQTYQQDDYNDFIL